MMLNSAARGKINGTLNYNFNNIIQQHKAVTHTWSKEHSLFTVVSLLDCQ